MARRGGGRRRPASLWLGLGLVAVGLGLLGYVGWQLWGTNIVSQQRQEEAVAALEREWRGPPAPPDEGRSGGADRDGERGGADRDGDRGGADRDGGRSTAAEAGAAAGTGEGAGAESVRLGRTTALLRIPRFGADYVMPVAEGVGDDVLARGYGHFEDSADVGERGNYALAAHRVTHGEPLRDMPLLRPGDEVVVETREARYTYVLDTDPNRLVVTFREVWVLDERPENPRQGGVGPADDPRLITLTTCAELFHTDDRMIAFGHLVDEEPKPPAR